MKRWMQMGCIALSMMAVSGVGNARAEMPSLDDFLSPVANEPKKGLIAPTAVNESNKVQITQEQVTTDGAPTLTVNAANAQDCVIAAKQKLTHQKQDVVVLKYPSGLGFMARGIATYAKYANRNSSLNSKRDAYVTAYIKAKANLAKLLYGLSNKSKQDLSETLDRYDAANPSLANKKAISSETIEQRVEGMIRGYVTYSVEDNPSSNTVEVVIVTTPKTQGRTMRAGGASMLAENAADGMKQVYAELKAKIIPPVGCKVVEVPGKEGPTFYFIAFGSAIIPSHADPEMARELYMAAFEEAEMRAGASLCALIIGDQMAWCRGVDEKTEKQLKDFDWQKASNDPSAGETTLVPKPLGQTIKDYVRVASKTSSYASAQQGKLPPGLMAQKWESEDGDWAFAAYVYNPAMTAAAAAARDTMINGPSILDRGSADGSRMGIGTPNPVDPTKDLPVQQGPSGSVVNDEDL